MDGTNAQATTAGAPKAIHTPLRDLHAEYAAACRAYDAGMRTVEATGGKGCLDAINALARMHWARGEIAKYQTRRELRAASVVNLAAYREA